MALLYKEFASKSDHNSVHNTYTVVQEETSVHCLKAILKINLPIGDGEGDIEVAETDVVEVVTGIDGSTIVVIWGMAVVAGVDEVAGVIVSDGVMVKDTKENNIYSHTVV